MKLDDIALGNRIKLARKARRLTQDELAARAGVAAISIRQWEIGKRSMSLWAFVSICAALGIQPGDMLSGLGEAVSG